MLKVGSRQSQPGVSQFRSEGNNHYQPHGSTGSWASGNIFHLKIVYKKGTPFGKIYSIRVWVVICKTKFIPFLGQFVY